MMSLGILSGKIEWKVGRRRTKRTRRKRKHLRLEMRLQFHMNSRWMKCSKFNEKGNTFPEQNYIKCIL
jgi:hypothetical protein